MCRQVSNAEIIEAGAVLASVALFDVCYGCFIMPRNGPGGVPRVMTGLGVCTFFLLAGAVLAITFGFARKGLLPEATVFPCFVAWKESSILAVNSLEVISAAIAVWLFLQRHVEFAWAGPILTHLCIALLAIRFTAKLKSPTPSVRRGLGVIAAVAVLASMVATMLLFGQYLGWVDHNDAFQCVICVAVLLTRPVSVAFVKLGKHWYGKGESTLELQRAESF
ncbi:uncharacterized protein BBA_09958 [Beauveria bassiana ARSEF 2860]|uniref:Uncharacterized protein n=1 Tax=Beauveria bassiana (strain ARSEF 2860) TaxID=655819 RepID=J5JAP8_BEAB2|nr:uncharacterized protein BBA_09958 [Beauveria bassiana ARSEF 2860]EJP61091.1 hypothetical protein BBA_09958 [Beauveria bassiana ARSEF 2860]